MTEATVLGPLESVHVLARQLREDDDDLFVMMMMMMMMIYL